MKKSMPIILWLAALEPDVFDRAVRVIEKESSKEFTEVQEVYSLKGAVMFAFDWTASEEGWVYWSNVYLSL